MDQQDASTDGGGRLVQLQCSGLNLVTWRKLQGVRKATVKEKGKTTQFRNVSSSVSLARSYPQEMCEDVYKALGAAFLVELFQSFLDGRKQYALILMCVYIYLL